MEYSLRCNRFRDYAQRSQQTQHKDIRNRLASPAFQPIRFLPPHQSAIIPADLMNLRNTNILIPTHLQTPIKRKELEPQSDKVTNRTEATYSTDFKNAQNRRAYSQQKNNSSFTLSDSSSTKKRKAHFLTVVSRLPGLNKGKPTICF